MASHRPRYVFMQHSVLAEPYAHAWTRTINIRASEMFRKNMCFECQRNPPICTGFAAHIRIVSFICPPYTSQCIPAAHYYASAPSPRRDRPSCRPHLQSPFHCSVYHPPCFLSLPASLGKLRRCQEGPAPGRYNTIACRHAHDITRVLSHLVRVH